MQPDAPRMTASAALRSMVVVLLAAAALRMADLPLMRGMLHYDEAYYAVDALSLLNAPRLTAFFPDNFGRESLWMYALTPALAVLGAELLALRLTACFVGVLTVAAVYRLGRELFGREAGVLGAAALAVLFWHVLASHQAFRALLYPLAGALAFAALWRVLRRDASFRTQVVTGALFGLLAYTYIAARAWLALAAVVLVVWTLRDRRRTAPALLLAGVCALAAAPLALTLLADPALAGQRSEQVAISSLPQLADNLRLWAGAWTVRGSADAAYTLPERPILDLPLALLTVAALASLVRRRVNGAGAFVLALWVVSLAPAVLTTDTLKPLRALGVVVPLALTIGAGMAALRTALGRTRLRPLSSVVIAALLTWAGANAARDISAWVRRGDLFLPMEQHVMTGADWLAAEGGVAPVYFAPFTPDHPVIRFRAGDLAPRPVSAFKADECLRLPASGAADYLALTLFDPAFADRLRPYAAVTLRRAEDAAPPRYALYHAQVRADAFPPPAVVWERRAGAALLNALPTTAAPGRTLALTLGLRALAPLDRAYTLFAHLYGDPTPYAGGTLWAQADAPLCLSSPPPTWRTDEVIVQTTTLTLPADLPPGRYEVALGVYDTLTGARLPVTTPDADLNYAVVGALVVEAGA